MLGDIEPFTGSGQTFSSKIEVPDKMPDVMLETRISLNQAQIYRLSGDYNALHVDPSATAFWRIRGAHPPWFMYVKVMLQICCSALFAVGRQAFPQTESAVSAPVYPGDTLGLRAWHDGDGRALFEAHVGEVVVINNAYFEYASA